MRKIFTACALAASCALLSPQISRCAELPEISGWQNGELRTTRLDTVSGNRGTWQERDYITGSGARVHAVWIEGAGEKGWSAPRADVLADDGLMGNGATYKTIAVSDEKAILECHPITGRSLAVKIEKMGTLTLESKYSGEKEILGAAAELIQKIKNEPAPLTDGKQ